MTSRIVRFGLAALFSALVIAQVPQVLAADPSPMNAVLTDQAIRDWLATHPEIIDKLVHDSYLRQPGLAQDGVAALQAKQQADRAAQLQKALPAAHDALYNDSRDGREGAVKPAASVVILYDFECPYCKALQPTIARLLQDHSDVSVIYKEFPILGPASIFAAKAALAAVEQGQGKFAALHAALIGSKIPEHQLKEEQVLDMAEAAGLDVDRLKTDMAKAEIGAKIAANKALAASLGIGGTPGVIIGNQLVPGNLPYERLAQMVEAAKVSVKQAALSK